MKYVTQESRHFSGERIKTYRKERKNMNQNSIIDLETCFAALGCHHPFAHNGDNLTSEGFETLDTLKAILMYLQNNSIISDFNEDKLDKFIFKGAY